MIDITHKSNTLRQATAQAIVKVSKQETITAIQEGTVPKGDVFSMSKAAGLLGVKKTADLLPDCHPMPIESTTIDYEINGLEITVKMTVKTIYKTGVEVEAMHGASIVALNMYDMLKPIDKGIEIVRIALIEKTGGKSSYRAPDSDDITAHVIVCSDSRSESAKGDRSGKAIADHLLSLGLRVNAPVIIPDEQDLIAATVTSSAQKVDLIVITGGTGLSPRDVTPEAVLPLLDKQLKGAEETIRRYGQERMPYAMLSRSVVGTIGQTIVMALPGSTGGVIESMQAVMPHLLHAFSVLKSESHDG